MTRQDAVEYVLSCGEDEGPASLHEAIELFEALYGRKPDNEDGASLGEIWSHCCAAVSAEESEPPSAKTPRRSGTMTTNKLVALEEAGPEIAINDELREQVRVAGVPGLMLCAKCGAQHIDPAAGGDSMRAASEGWVCALGYGCSDAEVAVRCECGQITDEQCQHVGPDAQDVVLEGRPLCAHCKAKPLIPGLNTSFCSEACEEAHAAAHPENGLVAAAYSLNIIDRDALGEAAGTGRVLSAHETREEALEAGRRYLRDHPGVWLQVVQEPGGQGEDVARQ